ncbi:hypothetical protein METBIDRAFT_69441 [Metschnikowia bicuspidata var. bicuspidata NRRL YB-4993]|uniref:BED-type domain-containing protein n=1 Tax=Metschnikowia bicuspidata var. bicuspidata NRRL YB-4993 TaxID=869754 RepID=A0A1A0HBC0_9ASCO|nr:hypothetical protein METBIDRAFT_69441 [Metschnikowia bicuspidata var. bicuspidata NRRL YB-4993]OBA21183.1 hypothetical protein METBIDRAFT_69441 [Metschnikowia bicuspidata var. bicuspidata NRRL YB-4993]
MSYFNGSSSGNNPLAFPSYNQQNLQQRNITGLSPANNPVNQLQNQYSESSLSAPLQQGENPASRQADEYINSESEVRNAQGSSASGTRSQQSLKKNRAEDGPKKTSLKKDRVNRPGQKFGAKKRLWVWSWFVQDLNDQNVAVCDFCGKVITRVTSDRGLPKKLVEHLHTHKLTKDLINASRPIPMDGSGNSYLSNLQTSYAGPFPQQSGNSGINDVVSSGTPGQIGLASPSQHPQQTYSSETQQLHPQSQVHISQLHTPNSNSQTQHSRRYILSKFENAPYSGPIFHRHLLKFLAENKLPIRILKLHSFQQLIYDLRPDSITDLLDLTGLYTSFVEVARAENLNETLSNNDSSIAETNVVNTLAQEMIKK